MVLGSPFFLFDADVGHSWPLGIRQKKTFRFDVVFRSANLPCGTHVRHSRPLGSPKYPWQEVPLVFAPAAAWPQKDMFRGSQRKGHAPSSYVGAGSPLNSWIVCTHFGEMGSYGRGVRGC